MFDVAVFLEELFFVSNSIYNLYKDIIHDNKHKNLDEKTRKVKIEKLKHALEYERTLYIDSDLNELKCYQLIRYIYDDGVNIYNYIPDELMITDEISEEKTTLMYSSIINRILNKSKKFIVDYALTKSENEMFFSKEEAKEIVMYDLMTEILIKLENEFETKNIDEDYVENRQLTFIFVFSNIETSFISNNFVIDKNMKINFSEYFDMFNYSYSKFLEQQTKVLAKWFLTIGNMASRYVDQEILISPIKDKFYYQALVLGIITDFTKGEEDFDSTLEKFELNTRYFRNDKQKENIVNELSKFIKQKR